jgi:hypothetical protein
MELLRWRSYSAGVSFWKRTTGIGCTEPRHSVFAVRRHSAKVE